MVLKGQQGLTCIQFSCSIKILKKVEISSCRLIMVLKELVPLLYPKSLSLLIVIKEFQEYVEPEEGYQGSPQRRGPSSGQEDEHVSLPLGDNVLTHNLGIPVLVVCTKVRLCFCLLLCKGFIASLVEGMLSTDVQNEFWINSEGICFTSEPIDINFYFYGIVITFSIIC